WDQRPVSDSPARGGAPSLVLDGEPQLSQHRDGTALSALEVAGAQALARGELIRRAQDGFRRVTAFVPHQVVGRGRAETMLGEERLRPQSVVVLYRAQHVSIGDAVPSHHVLTPPRIILARRGPGYGWPPAVWFSQVSGSPPSMCKARAGRNPVAQGHNKPL